MGFISIDDPGYGFYESSFWNAILHILLVCAEEQMIRINTRRDIAAMTNKNSIWDFAYIYGVTKPVSQHIPSISTGKLDNAVSPFIYCCMPQPARSRITTMYFSPKSIN